MHVVEASYPWSFSSALPASTGLQQDSEAHRRRILELLHARELASGKVYLIAEMDGSFSYKADSVPDSFDFLKRRLLEMDETGFALPRRFFDYPVSRLGPWLSKIYKLHLPTLTAVNTVFADDSLALRDSYSPGWTDAREYTMHVCWPDGEMFVRFRQQDIVDKEAGIRIPVNSILEVEARISGAQEEMSASDRLELAMLLHDHNGDIITWQKEHSEEDPFPYIIAIKPNEAAKLEGRS